MEIFDCKIFDFGMVLKYIFDSFRLYYLRMTLNISRHYLLQLVEIFLDNPVIYFVISRETKKDVEVCHFYKLKNYF